MSQALNLVGIFDALGDEAEMPDRDEAFGPMLGDFGDHAVARGTQGPDPFACDQER